MKIFCLYIFIKPWMGFKVTQIDSDMWQLKLGWLLIQRMPKGRC